MKLDFAAVKLLEDIMQHCFGRIIILKRIVFLDRWPLSSSKVFQVILCIFVIAFLSHGDLLFVVHITYIVARLSIFLVKGTLMCKSKHCSDQ